MNNFELAVGFTLRWEGDVNGSPHTDPNDPGGSTRWGLAQRFHPSVNVLLLNLDQAKAIYKSEYWDKYGCEALDFPMDCLHFDTCVNPGPVHASQFQVLSKTPLAYLLRRIAWYWSEAAAHPEKMRFRDGWIGRCVDFYKQFLA